MSDLFKTEVTLSNSGFLFDHNSGLTYSLNPTGQFIFQKLDEGEKPDDVLRSLMDEYSVDEDTARRDLDDFLRQLREMGILA